MERPLIGITATPEALRYNGKRDTLSQFYSRAVEQAGGIPLILPTHTYLHCLPELRQRLSGVLLSGGGDIDPKRFAGVESPTVDGVSHDRDELEFHLVKFSRETNWPLLAICRGEQVMNVALGGTLYTDIPSQYATPLVHSTSTEKGRDFLAHEVTIQAGTHLAEIIGAERLGVNSFHHQVIQTVAPSLRVTAHATDGLVEGVELADHPFFLGVQWHPECLTAHAEERALFAAFVQAATRDRI
jgi:putative glutamine amidotransferase